MWLTFTRFSTDRFFTSVAVIISVMFAAAVCAAVEIPVSVEGPALSFSLIGESASLTDQLTQSKIAAKPEKSAETKSKKELPKDTARA